MLPPSVKPSTVGGRGGDRGGLGGHLGAACQLVYFSALDRVPLVQSSHAEQAMQLSWDVEWLKKLQFSMESQKALQPSGVAL